MDVTTIYKLMKPHLDLLNPSEKAALSKLITSPKPSKVTCTHRKKLSITKAKEHLKIFCRQEMEREKQTAI
ncbi:hypothetical protein [Salinimicrobium terrae]|uniref:hypothetical protein n=1 Tax=Salinimicrobium terrae TaxID=470866 RepID=UPI00048EA992|nr:hypothetical protein [Salinimicrobium terrae]